MADGSRSVPDIHFADRCLSGPGTVDQVGAVITTDVKALGTRWKGLGEEVRVAGLDVATGDKNPSVFALEGHSMSLPIVDAPSRGIGGIGALAGMSDAIVVGIVDPIIRRSGITPGDHGADRLSLDCGGAALFHPHAPQSDIVVVRSPVGHCPA